MKSNKTYSLKLISQYRALLMGIAIVMIAFCHPDVALKHNGLPVSKIASVLHLCTVGVDIFMFLSGFGLWYSLKKKPDVKSYEKRRIRKLLPPYLIIAGITYLLYDIPIKNLGIQKFAEDISFVSWFKYGSTRYWFVAAIVVFSSVFPMIFRYIENNSVSDQIKLIVFFAGFFVITLLLDNRFELYSQFKIAIERLPIFILGAACAKRTEKNPELSRIVLTVIIISGLVFTGGQYAVRPFKTWVANTHYMYYLSRALFGLSLIALITIISSKLEGCNKIFSSVMSAFVFLGAITYEIYLFHQSYLILFEFPPGPIGYFCTAVLLPVCSAMILSWIRKHRAEKAAGS